MLKAATEYSKFGLHQMQVNFRFNEVLNISKNLYAYIISSSFECTFGDPML